MKLHHTLVETLITVFEINGGWKEQKKLREALHKLDFTIYKQQQTGNDVLVATADLERALQQIQERQKK